ncbi:MAG: hypothetical protein U0P81_10915 [Holophagaceae bacterium]
MSPAVRVQAFGADVLAAASGWQAALAVVAGEHPAPVLAVVDAPSPCRAALDRSLAAAGRGEPDRAAAEAREASDLLHALAGDLGSQAPYLQAADTLLRRLGELVQGAALVGHASPRTRGAAQAALGGLSATLFAAALARRGLRARVELPGPADARAQPPGPPRPPGPETLQVLAGGAGTEDGDPSWPEGPGDPVQAAVGRACAWGLREVCIWTLEEGILTADPSLVPGARRLPVLSHAEALALSGFGGRALPPEVLLRAEAAGLELRVANLLRPAASTRVTRHAPPREPGSVACVAYKEGLHLLRLPARGDLEALARTDRDLREAGVHRFGAIVGPEGTLLVVRAASESAVRALAATADRGVEVQAGWALVALVGEGLRATPGGALRLLAPVGLERVGGLLAGSSPISVSFLVPEDRLGDLVPRLHRIHLEAAARPLALAPLSL